MPDCPGRPFLDATELSRIDGRLMMRPRLAAAATSSRSWFIRRESPNIHCWGMRVQNALQLPSFLRQQLQNVNLRRHTLCSLTETTNCPENDLSENHGLSNTSDGRHPCLSGWRRSGGAACLNVSWD